MSLWFWFVLGVAVIALAGAILSRKSDRRRSGSDGGYYSGGRSSGEHVPGRKDSWDNDSGGGDGGGGD